MFSRKNYRAAFPKDKNENFSRWQLSDRNFKDDNTEYRTSEQRNKNEKKVICVSYKNQLELSIQCVNEHSNEWEL